MVITTLNVLVLRLSVAPHSQGDHALTVATGHLLDSCKDSRTEISNLSKERKDAEVMWPWQKMMVCSEEGEKPSN